MKKILALLVAIMMLAMAIPAMAELPAVTANGTTVELIELNTRVENEKLNAAFATVLNNDKVVAELFAVKGLTEETEATIVTDAQYAKVFDGAAWGELVGNTGNQIVLTLKDGYVVALLNDFVPAAFENINVLDATAATVGEEVTTPDTPSIGNKLAPALKEEGALIKVGEETPVVIKPSYLIITPLMMSEETTDAITREMLNWAYNDVMQNGIATVEADIEAQLADGLTYENMIVRDLFEVSLYGEENLAALAQEGAKIEFELVAGLVPGETVVVLMSVDGATWQVLPAEAFEVTENGDLKLTVAELGVVAILVELESEPAVTSPAN